MEGIKTIATVIMDGSNRSIVKDIIDTVDLITGNRHGQSKVRALDSDHPTMKVVETITNDGTYAIIKEAIEVGYPGLCVFNAVV